MGKLQEAQSPDKVVAKLPARSKEDPKWSEAGRQKSRLVGYWVWQGPGDQLGRMVWGVRGDANI